MKKYIPLTLGLLAIVFLLAFSVGQGQAQEGGRAEEGSLPDAVEENVGPYIPVQGRLKDASGNPLNGDFSVTFRLYDVESGGIELCHDTNTVTVANGLFNSEIYGNCAGEMDGKQLYLGIEVGTDGEMSPRQPIYAVPYAWSLRPNATISGTVNSDAVLHIENSGTGGRGLRAYAMSTTGANYGIIGASRSPDGFAGYFYNNGGGVGLYAHSSSNNNYSIIGVMGDYSADDYTGTYKSGGLFGGVNGVIGISHETVPVGAGVYGWAQSTTGTSYGVHGRADSNTNGYGVWGEATASAGNTRGVYGSSASTAGRGVYGLASAASGTTTGVYGEANSTSGRGVYGVADSTGGGVGVYGVSNVGSGVYGNSTSGYGVYGLSTSNNALYADTQAADHNYGLYTGDNIYSNNFHSKGAMMQVVQNGGSEPLEAGDVVVFSGMIAPADANEPPVILVSKATTQNSTAVAGVVYARSSLEGGTLEGATQPGEYLLVVVQGPARVKASAAAGAIQPGDLLSSSAQAGVAASAAKLTIEGIQTVLPGTVFAKALEALVNGEGWIYVFVTLQ